MRRLLLPSLALVAAAVADYATDGSWRSAPALVDVSRVVFAVVVLLAWRLRRGRVAWAALALAAVSALPDLGLPGETLEAALLGAGLWLCLDLAAAAWQGEWWLLSRPGAVRVGVLAAQAASVAWLTRPSASPALEALRRLGASPAADGADGAPQAMGLAGWLEKAPALGVEPVLVLAFAVSLLAALGALLRRRGALEAGCFGALLAVAPAWTVAGGHRYYLAAAGLVLALALVENAFTLAFQDGLTGLPARRALEERLAQLGRGYALAMLDLDHFKKLNDRHGHEVGDQVLKLVAARLRSITGGGEAFRYGGEEFTVVFAGRSADEAKVHLDALRQQIAGRPFTVRSPGRPTQKPTSPRPRPKAIEKQLKVTVSIGVAERGDRAATPEAVMKAADKALYKSKKAGRNRVTVA